MSYIWKFKGTDMGYAIECSNCKHKIGVKDAVIAEKKIDVCPFCNKKMDMSSFNYDELFSLAYGEARDA